MKIIFPDFYKDFTCIADKCPDSCCKEWDVVIDDSSAEVYNNLKSNFGKKLQKAMMIDDDGDTIFTLTKDKKCPFWNEDCLCDIYIKLGKEYLCRTCQNFPRITMQYADFEERILSFACPEAARIMLSKKNIKIVEEFDGTNDDSFYYEKEKMKQLILARNLILKILSDDKRTLKNKFRSLALISHSTQIELFSPSSINRDRDYKKFQYKFFTINAYNTLDILRHMDIMTPEFKILVDKAYSTTLNREDLQKFYEFSKSFHHEFGNLAFYYVFRYYLNSISNYSVLFCLNLILFAYRSIFLILCAEYKRNENIDFEKRVKIYQLYSKEIEHSYENIELLKEIFEKSEEYYD